MVTWDLGVDRERFYLLRAWNVVIGDLLVREELEQRAISYEKLPQIFHALVVPPIIPLPVPPAQGPPPLPLPLRTLAP